VAAVGGKFELFAGGAFHLSPLMNCSAAERPFLSCFVLLPVKAANLWSFSSWEFKFVGEIYVDTWEKGDFSADKMFIFQ
jgi:hypothetical protein